MEKGPTKKVEGEVKPRFIIFTERDVIQWKGAQYFFSQKAKLNKALTDWTATDWTSLGGSFKIASWNVAGNFSEQSFHYQHTSFSHLKV